MQSRKRERQRDVIGPEQRQETKSAGVSMLACWYPVSLLTSGLTSLAVFLSGRHFGWFETKTSSLKNANNTK